MFSRFLGNQTYWNLFLFFTIFPLPYIVISETGIRISYSRSGSKIIYALQWLIFIFLVYCFQGNIDYLKSTFNQTPIVLQTLVKFPQRSEQRRKVGKTSIEKARYDPEKLYRTIWTSLDFQSQLIQIDEYWTKCSQILDLKIDQWCFDGLLIRYHKSHRYCWKQGYECVVNRPSSQILDTQNEGSWEQGWYCFLVDKNKDQLEVNRCSEATHPYICETGRWK